MLHSDLLLLVSVLVVLAMIAGYQAGSNVGYNRARKELMPQLNMATHDYRESREQLLKATRLVDKMRNRLRAGHILALKTKLNQCDRLAK